MSISCIRKDHKPTAITDIFGVKKLMSNRIPQCSVIYHNIDGQKTYRHDRER